MVLDTILGAIAKKAGQLAANQIIKEFSRLSRVREDLEWIEIEMGHIEDNLVDAEAIQLKSASVSNFIRDSWNLAYDVEDIIDTYFPKLIASWSMGIARGFAIEVEGIKKRVKDIAEARKDFEAHARISRLQVVTTYERQTFPHVDESNVVGIDAIIEVLKQNVLNEDLSIIGTGGLGKTTLARKVYNSVRHFFDRAAWICVTERPNIQKLLRDIAGQVGLEKEKMEQNLETNLSELLKTIRYVIVIDDIWDTAAWDALKIHLPTNSENKRRIILTSRNENVGLGVGGRTSLFELQPLDSNTSKQLFYTTIADDPQNISETQYSPELKRIGEQILERCGGLPLPILLAAGLIKGRSDSEWEKVLEGIRGMGEYKDKWFNIFVLSYKDLTLDLKPCFLYFGLFPEDREIEAFELINLWAAEGFIRGSEKREVEDVGYDYLNTLIARKLIQIKEMSRCNRRVFSVQIHDILHSLCIPEANEINFLNIHTDAVNSHTTVKVRRVAIHCSDISHYLSLNPQTSRVRAMLCFLRDTQWKRRGTQKLLRFSKFLRVLRIENKYTSSSLLTEICNLRQMTYLKLTIREELAKLPSAISNLENLVTLDLQEIKAIKHLPNVIWSMKQLRHLLLPEYRITSKHRKKWWGKSEPVEFSLTNLQTLYGLPGDSFEADWLYKLTNLRTLRVNELMIPISTESKDIIAILSDGEPISHKLEELWMTTSLLTQLKTNSLILSQYEKLCNLHLERIEMTELPQHDKLPPNLMILTLTNTLIKKDPMETLKKLKNLKILRLMQWSYDGKELVSSGEHAFPELEVLQIEDLENIEKVVVEEGGMPKLKDFKISNNKFTRMPETQIPDRLRDIIVTTTV